MNNRHREQLSTAFVSKTMSLVRFLLDKSQQSRKITQWCFIDPRACASANSYLGLLRHCTERRNEQRLADAVLNKYGRWLYFVIEAGHFICRVKRAFTSRFQHMAAIAALIKRYRRIALCPA